MARTWIQWCFMDQRSPSEPSVRMKPEPGPYGPVGWRESRPWTMWAFATTTLLIGTTQTWAAREFSIPWLGLAFTAVFLWLLLRGSKIAWWFGVVGSSISLLGQIPAYLANRDTSTLMTPSPNAQLLMIVLVAAGLVLLLVPSTRDWFDLEKRHNLRSSSTDRQASRSTLKSD